MRRSWIAMMAMAMALALALPAEARKPVKPDRPDAGFKPMVCRVDVPVATADVRNAGGTIPDVPAENGAFTLVATELGGFNETRYTVEPGTSELDDVLCLEVALVDGTLRDLRVRWLGCDNCGLYRAAGKDLRNFNNGGVFSAGVAAAEWVDSSGGKTVAVMPSTKSDTATMTVTIGIDRP